MDTQQVARQVEYRRAFVCIDDGPSFGAWIVEGEYWNGWACPLFNEVEAARVGEVYGGRYDECSGVWFFADGFGDEQDFRSEVIDGERCWAIGAFCWTWDEDWGAQALASVILGEEVDLAQAFAMWMDGEADMGWLECGAVMIRLGGMFESLQAARRAGS